MSDSNIILIVLVVAIFVSAIIAFLSHPRDRNEEVLRQKTRSEEISERYKKQNILRYLESGVREKFGVELDTIHENTTQDEIVRIVNLLASQTATACVNQDKAGRNGGSLSDWDDDDVNHLKRAWARKRNFAIEIAPELINRLPHFSEFEPLKSYNAEHLMRKRIAQQ